MSGPTCSDNLPALACCCQPPPDRQHEPPTLPRRDPLIINLDGNGITTLGFEAGVHFDHDGDGFQELTGWIGPGSAFLMLDVNGNEVPDKGERIFWRFHHSS